MKTTLLILIFIPTVLSAQADSSQLKEQYFKTLHEADALYNQSNWQDARRIYERACQLLHREYCLDQIKRCEDHMRSASHSEAAKQYRKIMNVAAQKILEKQYRLGFDYYKRASSIKPEDQLPRDLIQILIKRDTSVTQDEMHADIVISFAEKFHKYKDTVNRDLFIQEMDQLIFSWPILKQRKTELQKMAGDS